MRRRIMVACATFAVLAAACGGSPAAQASPAAQPATTAATAQPDKYANLPAEIVIGVVATLTGPQANAGTNTKIGVELAIKEINEKGGIAKRPVRAILKDDEANAAKAVTAAKALLESDKAAVIIGTTVSPATAALEAVVNEAKVLHLIPNAAADSLVDAQKFPYTFRGFTITSTGFAAAMAEYVKKHNVQKIAYIVRADQFGKDGVAVTKALFEKELPSVQTVATEEMGPNDTDVSAQMLRIQAAKPDLVLAWVYHQNGLTILRSGKKVNYLPKMIVAETYAKAYWDAGVSEVQQTLGIQLTNWVFPLRAKSKALDEQLTQLYGRDRTYGNYAVAQGYDNVYLLKQAIEETGSTSGDVLKKYLESGATYDGVNAVVKFAPDRHEGVGAGGTAVVKIGPKFEQAMYAPAD